ncbi:hypothetical protein PGB34_11860 [Xenophilus arseniciresistens]|uniref:Lipoprotein n=1 Tax=Xenophilus arseniciresistens TaxID=1283306 RepID=A0AAE3N9F8_9BURK|nr:hypothetical protein [Xenophilus arseniciresistens]MDA7417058.1 hypothetical protein [Xenophilus arseniciresistens]
MKTVAARSGLLAAALVLAGCAAPTDPNCPPAGARLPPGALFGAWEARIGEGNAPRLRVDLQPHPDYAGVRGQVLRGAAAPAQLAGDINDEGVLLLDESADGRSISAVWEGELLARSCGRVFRGHWRRAGEDQGQPFELTRIGTTP